MSVKKGVHRMGYAGLQLRFLLWGVKCEEGDEDEVLNLVQVFTGSQIWISHRRCCESIGTVDHGTCGLKGAISSLSVSGYRLQLSIIKFSNKHFLKASF